MHIKFIHSHYESLGIEYLSSVLKEAGHKTSLAFEPALFHNFFANNSFLYKISNFKNYILESVEKDNPDIVAFSVISDNYNWSLDIARQIKRKLNTTIVFGGIHPTSVPKYVLRDGIADYVIVGEGEEAFLNLVNALEGNKTVSNIPNIGVYNNGKSYVNDVRPPIQNIDDLPFPDKDLFFNDYHGLVDSSYAIMGSRGCNNRCSYCWNSTIDRLHRGGVYFRRRSPENLIAELKWAKKRYNITKVTFYDEVFTSSKQWLNDFLLLYQEEIRLPFFCCIHPSDVDAEITSLLSKAGCKAVNVGVQTANEELRKSVLQRKGSNEEIIRALQLLGDTNIFVYSNIILGLPGESEDDLISTLKFCNTYKADIPAIYWLRYYPQTKIVEIAKNMGLLTSDDVEKINSGREYFPYAILGNTYRKDAAKIGNLILVSGIISSSVMNYIIAHRLYRRITSKNLLFPAILVIVWFKRVIKSKSYALHYLDLWDYIKLYLFYISKKIRYKLCLFGKK